MSSKDKMYPIVKQYQESGLSISSFCKKNKLAASTFRYWIEQYNNWEKSNRSSSFIAVETTRPDPGFVEINYPNKVSIKVALGTDLSFLKALVNLY